MSTQSYPGTVPQFTLGDRLRKARETSGKTVRDFASEIGVSTKTITDAENDRRNVRKITVRMYSLATGVPLGWLETGNAPRPGGPGGEEGGARLPRLDSNQQPFGYRSDVVRLTPRPADRVLVAA